MNFVLTPVPMPFQLSTVRGSAEKVVAIIVDIWVEEREGRGEGKSDIAGSDASCHPE